MVLNISHFGLEFGHLGREKRRREEEEERREEEKKKKEEKKERRICVWNKLLRYGY